MRSPARSPPCWAIPQGRARSRPTPGGGSRSTTPLRWRCARPSRRSRSSSRARRETAVAIPSSPGEMAVRFLTVFCWHNVQPSWLTPYPAGRGPAGFEHQVRVIASGFSVMPLGEALRKLDSGAGLPPRPAALTFDDGYRDALGFAAPALARLSLPATFFLIPGLLSREVSPWWEVIAWAFARATRSRVAWEEQQFGLNDDANRARACTAVLEQLKLRDAAARGAAIGELVEALAPEGANDADALFLDWDGARELAARRGVEIGSHTRTHPILSR